MKDNTGLTKLIVREIEIKYKSYKKIKQIKFSCCSDITDILKSLKIGIEGREVFIAFYLNNQNEIVAFNKSTGTIDQAVIYPREVARMALYNDAARVIFAHNHPSGNLNPSQNDIDITRKLKDGLEGIDIEVLDHLIINDKYEYYSFREKNLLI